MNVEVTEDAIKAEISKCRMFIDFMLKQQQWSGINREDIDRWISNFAGISESEKLLAYKLLSNLIYYSEKDVIEALKEGIYNCLLKKTISEKQILSDFTLSSQALLQIEKDELKKTCFIPLLDSNAPHESGNYVSRLLVQQGMINSDHSIFLNNIEETFNTIGFSRLVIIDDCVGSGDQLRDFWNINAEVKFNGKNTLLKNYCRAKKIDVNYLTLFGYEPSIERLKSELAELNICCVRGLNDLQRVFVEGSYVWENEVERKIAIKFFERLTRDVMIPFYGYKGLDFAFIMHRTIPDWSLPIFWKEKDDWQLLLRRKNSNA